MAAVTTLACPICNAENPPSAVACGTCGAPLGSDPSSAFSGALPPGTKLQGGMYSVGKVLGQGGFGIQTAPAAARLGAQLLLGLPRDRVSETLDAALYSPARFG